MEITKETIINLYGIMAHSIYLYALFSAILLDILTGTLKAIVNKRYNSTIGTKGIAKHTAVIILTLIATPFLIMLEFDYVAKLLIISFTYSYIMSVLENCTELGVPIPKAIYDVLVKAGGKIDTVNFKDIKSVNIDKTKEEIKIETKEGDK